MRSLSGRLLALWLMLAASAVITGFLLFEFYRQSANAQVSQAEEAIARGCRDIAGDSVDHEPRLHRARAGVQSAARRVGRSRADRAWFCIVARRNPAVVVAQDRPARGGACRPCGWRREPGGRTHR